MPLNSCCNSSNNCPTTAGIIETREAFYMRMTYTPGQIELYESLERIRLNKARAKYAGVNAGIFNRLKSLYNDIR